MRFPPIPQDHWTDAQRAVAKAIADGKLKGNEIMPARMQLTIGDIGLSFALDGEIKLE